MTLQKISDGVWRAQSSVRLLPGAHLPLDMTVLGLADGSLALHSPSQIDDTLASELQQLGRVSMVIAPNRLHHLHAQAALERFPNARCFAAAGVEQKQPQLEITSAIEAAGSTLGRDFALFQVDGAPKLNEWVFFHRASGSLVATDLVFNVQEPRGWLTPWVLRGAGTYRRLAVSRLVASQVEDRQACARSLRPMLDVPLQRLLMSHGQPVLSDAKAQLRAALSERFTELR